MILGVEIDRTDRKILGILCALALLLRIGVALEYRAEHPLADHPTIDEAAYEDWALEIAGGDWLGEEVFFQEPLYPYWMGSVYTAFGPRRTAVRHLQASLGAVVVGLVYLLARRSFSRPAAIVAGAAMALHRPALLMPSLLLKPNLVLPLLALLALLLPWARGGPPRRWLAVGVVAGLGSLLRGNLLLLLPLLTLWPLLRTRGELVLSRSWRDCAAVLLGASLVLAPVACRNLFVGDVFALSTSGAGTNVHGGNNAANPLGRATEFDWVRGIPEHEAADWRREAERRLERELNPGEVSSYWLAETGRSVVANPALHLGILWNKLRLTLGAHEVPDNHHLEWDARYLRLLRLPWPGFGLSGTLGLAGLLCLLLRSRAGRFGGPGPGAPGAAMDLALLFGLYTLTIVLTVTSMRVRLALVPLLMPFAGDFAARAADSMRGLLRGGEGRGVASVLVVSLALAGAWVGWPLLGPAELQADLDGRDMNLAHSLLEDPARLDEADALAGELDARQPGTSRIQTLRAEIECRRALRLALGDGRPEEIQSLVHTALARLELVALSPEINGRERWRAHKLAGLVRLETGEASGALTHLRAALEFDPDDVEVLRGAGAAALLASARLAPGAGGDAERRLLLDEAGGHARRASDASEGADPIGARSRLLLANVLFLSGEGVEAGPEREVLLREAEMLLHELLARWPGRAEEFESRLGAIRELRESPGATSRE